MIYDTDGNRILNANIALGSAEVKTATVRIEAQAGKSLSGTATADVTVEARAVGVVPWTNIETTPIALDTWAGTFQDFEVRFTSGTVTSRARRKFTLSVGPS